MTIEYRTCLYCGKEWRTGTMDPNRYCSTGCWADALDEDDRDHDAPCRTMTHRKACVMVDRPPARP